MMRPASSRKQASKKHYPVVGFPSGQREQTVNLPSSTSKVRILPPPPSLSTTSKFELPLVGFPSGQREQTVNLPSSTSKVRILPPPPSLSKVRELSNESAIKYSAHAGKDEKPRPRFDSSASERAWPQATTRRAKRAALSNPSPTTITSLNNQNLLLRANFARWHHVYRAYNILPCRSDKRSASDNSPRTVPIKKPRRSRVYVN